MHDFREKLSDGQRTELNLIAHIQDRFPDTLVRRATREDERRGIDIWLKRADDGALIRIQVKSDKRMGKTGNFFLETWSVWPQKKGWIWTTEADQVCYVDESDWSVYWISMKALREAFCELWQNRREVDVQNDGWITKGVPIHKNELIERLHPLTTNLSSDDDDNYFDEPEPDDEPPPARWSANITYITEPTGQLAF